MKVLDYSFEIKDERSDDLTAHELVSVKAVVILESEIGRREQEVVFFNDGDTMLYLSPAYRENDRFFEDFQAFIGEEGVDPLAVVEGLDLVHAHAQVLLDAFLTNELESFLAKAGMH